VYVFVVVPLATVTKQGLVLYIYVSLDLEEDWYHSEDPVNAGVTFFVKYLGCTGVTRTHGTGSTDEAVKTIVQDVSLPLVAETRPPCLNIVVP
jgi:hypothetical protein